MNNNITHTPKYKCIGISTNHVGNGNTFVYSSLRQVGKIYPETYALLLLTCQKFQTLENHAINQLKAIKQYHLLNNGDNSGTSTPFGQDTTSLHKSISKEEIDPIVQLLETFVEDGFLWAESDLLPHIKLSSKQELSSLNAENQITTVAFPTRNRPNSLNRAMRSYLDNFKSYDRDVRIMVIDDSRSLEEQSSNKEVVSALAEQSNFSITHTDYNHRLQFARSLAKHAHIDPQITQFALFGDERCEKTYGAGRNVFLLLAPNEVTMQLDDDTVCEIMAVPDYQSGLSFTAKGDSNQYWFYKTFEEATQSLEIVEKDFLGLHEQLLGRPISQICNDYQDGNINFNDASPEMLENLRAPDAQVSISHIGSVGDSGLYNLLYRLFLENRPFEKLDPGTPGDLSNPRARCILRASTMNSINDGYKCVAMNVGLDNRLLLPPFMPVQRNEDGLFLSVQRRTYPNTFSGYLPYAFVHDPPEYRVYSKEDLISNVTPPRVNDIIQWLLNVFYVPFSRTEPENNLLLIGHYLHNLSGMPL